MPKIIDGDVLNYLQNKIKDNYANKDGDLHLQEKELNYSNEVQTIVPDTGYNGISKVKLPGLKLEETTVKSTKVQQEIYPGTDVNRDSYIKRVTVQPRTLQEKTITIVAVTDYTPFTPIVMESDENFNGLSKVTATSVVNMQSKTVNYSNQPQEVIADEGYSGLSSVTLNPDTRYYNDSYQNTRTLVVTDDDFYPSDLKKERTIVLPKYSFIGTLQSEYITTLHLKRMLGQTGYAYSGNIEARICYCPAKIYAQNANIDIEVTDLELMAYETETEEDTQTTINKKFVTCNIQEIQGLSIAIKDYALWGAESLTTLPPIRELGKYALAFAFNNYANLITLTDAVTKIPIKAFYSSKVRTLSLGPNITSIADDAFYNCTSLATITIRGNSSCITAQALQALDPSDYNNATIVYTE